MPYKSELTALVRLLQAIGIWLCFTSGRLARCPCLADILHTEGENAVKELVATAPREWLGLPTSTPPDG